MVTFFWLVSIAFTVLAGCGIIWDCFILQQVHNAIVWIAVAIIPAVYAFAVDRLMTK